MRNSGNDLPCPFCFLPEGASRISVTSFVRAWELAPFWDWVSANQLNQPARPDPGAGLHSSVLMHRQAKLWDSKARAWPSFPCLSVNIVPSFNQTAKALHSLQLCLDNLLTNVLKKHLPSSGYFEAVPEWQEILWAVRIHQDRKYLWLDWRLSRELCPEKSSEESQLLCKNTQVMQQLREAEDQLWTSYMYRSQFKLSSDLDLAWALYLIYLSLSQQVSEDMGFNTSSHNFNSDLCLSDTSATSPTTKSDAHSRVDVMRIMGGQL